MPGALEGWWPLSTGSSAGAPAAEQLEDLEDILKEPGPDATLPVSSSSVTYLMEELESPEKQQGQQQGQQQAQQGQQHPSGGPTAAQPAAGSSSSWASYLPSMPSVSAWLPSSTTGHHEQPQQQRQQQSEQAGPAHALWRHYLPTTLGGGGPRAAGAVGQRQEGADISTTAAPSTVSGIAAAAGQAAGAAVSTAGAWAAAAQHQLSAACEHVAASSLGVSAVGAAVGAAIAGPLGAAAGAKSGAAIVAAGALGGAAVKHVRDRRSGSAGTSCPASPTGAAAGSGAAGMEQELQPIHQAGER